MSTEHTEMLHTPGPWTAGDDKGNGALHMVYCDDSLGSRVADCSEPGHGITYAQIEANVRLIAAAPELLEALRECELLIRYSVEARALSADNAAWAAAKAAIAKAMVPVSVR